MLHVPAFIVGDPADAARCAKALAKKHVTAFRKTGQWPEFTLAEAEGPLRLEDWWPMKLRGTPRDSPARAPKPWVFAYDAYVQTLLDDSRARADLAAARGRLAELAGSDVGAVHLLTSRADYAGRAATQAACHALAKTLLDDPYRCVVHTHATTLADVADRAIRWLVATKMSTVGNVRHRLEALAWDVEKRSDDELYRRIAQGAQYLLDGPSALATRRLDAAVTQIERAMRAQDEPIRTAGLGMLHDHAASLVGAAYAHAKRDTATKARTSKRSKSN